MSIRKRKKTPEVADQSVSEKPQSVLETIPLTTSDEPEAPPQRMTGEELKGLLRQQRRETRKKERGY